jgi:hypothetical protein
MPSFQRAPRPVCLQVHRSVKSVVLEIRRVDLVRHLELSMVENLIKHAHRHGFVSCLDRPIKSWLPLGHQQSAGQETLGEEGQQAHGYLSADDLRRWHTVAAYPRLELMIIKQR